MKIDGTNDTNQAETIKELADIDEAADVEEPISNPDTLEDENGNAVHTTQH